MHAASDVARFYSGHRSYLLSRTFKRVESWWLSWYFLFHLPGYLRRVALCERLHRLVPSQMTAQQAVEAHAQKFASCVVLAHVLLLSSVYVGLLGRTIVLLLYL